jgi:preprotein translocase subunit SecB
MANTGNGGQPGSPAGTPAGAPSQDRPVQLNVLAQYIKDLSFENPNAPRSLQPTEQPSINIQINLGTQKLSDTDYEVELKIEGKADSAGTMLFGFELAYAGIFRLQNIPEDTLQPVLMIECPRLLFPFAREIIASSVRSGGFPPLMIDPVDFVGLYRQRLAEGQPQSPAA